MSPVPIVIHNAIAHTADTWSVQVLTDWLTPGSRVLLESNQLLSQWSISPPRFIIMLKWASHLSVTWARLIQSTLFLSISWSSILILSSKLLFPSCSPTMSLLHHIHHMDHEFHPQWSLKSLVCVHTQTDLPVQLTNIQQVLLRFHKADFYHFAFHYSPLSTKFNKHRRTLLVILYVMLWSTAFPIFFSNLTSTSCDDEDNKKCTCAHAHTHTLFMEI